MEQSLQSRALEFADALQMPRYEKAEARVWAIQYVDKKGDPPTYKLRMPDGGVAYFETDSDDDISVSDDPQHGDYFVVDAAGNLYVIPKGEFEANYTVSD